jgi:hypothetical protein
MKPPIIATALFLFLGQSAMSEETHDHTHNKKEAGSNGGRIVTATEPHFEFFVTPERKMQITFLGDDGKAIALSTQSVSAMAGERSAPIKVIFTKAGDSLVSDVALPKGMLVPLILTVKLSDTAKPVLEKFNVNMANCSECDLLEYACICAH